MKVITVADYIQVCGGNPLATIAGVLAAAPPVVSFVQNFRTETGSIIYHAALDSTPPPPPIVTSSNDYRDFHDYARDNTNASFSQTASLPNWYGVMS